MNQEVLDLNLKKGGRISTSAIIVMSSVVLSRITGFVRETMLSWKVGLSWVQDAYVAAFAVPDLIYILLVGGTISAALVPFLSGKLERGEEAEGWKAVSSFINAVLICMTVLCALGAVFAPKIIPVVAPGFSSQNIHTRELAVRLARILFPSVSFIMLAGICNGVLNSYKKFAAAAYGPSIYNAGCALSIYLFADTDPESMVKVAKGVAVSAVVYFSLQLFFSRYQFRLYKPVINFSDGEFRKLFSQALPSLLSSSISQINIIISSAFVSLSFTEGSISAFRNANTLWQLPYGIFAMGIGTAILPALSGKFAAGEHDEYESLLMKSLTSVLFLAVPSAAGFIVLREPLVRAVFKWGGKFSDADVPAVASILALFSISMVTQSVVAIMNRAFYARQDTRTPLLIGLGSVLLNLGICTVFYHFTNLAASGMALAYSAISTINSVLLVFFLNKKIEGIHLRKLLHFFARALPSALIMAVALFLFERFPMRLDTKFLQLLYLGAEMLIGAVVYSAIMFLLRADEAIYMVKIIKRRPGL